MGMEKTFNNTESAVENPVTRAAEAIAPMFEGIPTKGLERIIKNPYFDNFANREI